MIKVSGCVSTKIESNDTIPTKIKINSDFRQKKPQHGRKFAAWPCPWYGKRMVDIFQKGPFTLFVLME